MRDDASTLGNDDRARVTRHLLLQAGTDEGCPWIEERHRLTLHVRAHERAVRVIVLEERNQCRSDRDELFRRDIHVVHAIARHERHVALLAAEHQVVGERAVVVELRVGLRDDGVFFAVGVEPDDLVVRHLAVLDDTIGRLDETEVVHARKARE